MMQGWRSLAGALVIAALAWPGGTVLAQERQGPEILTIDQERLFIESEFGKALLASESARAEALEAENARIERDLITEEQDLTDRRATLSAEEFSALATAFDEKVVRIRAEQDAKARELTRSRDEDRQAFFRAAIPVLGDLLVERKAVAIIDKSSVILSLTAIDVTDAAIAKVDAALRAQGEGPEAAPSPAPDDPGGTDVPAAPSP
jgi:Skp family chaperone for outer membrane proteins